MNELDYRINYAFDRADEVLAAAAKMARDVADNIEHHRAMIAARRTDESKPLSARLYDASRLCNYAPGSALSLLGNMRLDLIADRQSDLHDLAQRVKDTEALTPIEILTQSK